MYRCTTWTRYRKDARYRKGTRYRKGAREEKGQGAQALTLFDFDQPFFLYQQQVHILHLISHASEQLALAAYRPTNKVGFSRNASWLLVLQLVEYPPTNQIQTKVPAMDLKQSLS